MFAFNPVVKYSDEGGVELTSFVTPTLFTMGVRVKIMWHPFQLQFCRRIFWSSCVIFDRRHLESKVHNQCVDFY